MPAIPIRYLIAGGLLILLTVAIWFGKLHYQGLVKDLETTKAQLATEKIQSEILRANGEALKRQAAEAADRLKRLEDNRARDLAEWKLLSQELLTVPETTTNEKDPSVDPEVDALNRLNERADRLLERATKPD